MKKIILIELCMISLLLLVAGSYKPLIYKIFNDYEEGCVRYKMNVITTYELIGESSWREFRFANHTEYVPTDECIEYGLRRSLCNPNNDSCYFNRTYIDKGWKINTTLWNYT